MRFVLLLTLGLALEGCASAQLAWDYEQEVSFAAQHDPGIVQFADGTQVEVRYSLPDRILLPFPLQWMGFGEVNNWEAGRALAIVYRGDTGPLLLDPESDHVLPVMTFYTIEPQLKHPIDALMAACVDQPENSSTAGIVGCVDQAFQRWTREIDRLMGVLLERLSPEQADALRQSQDRWNAFREADLTAAAAIDNQGTIARITNAYYAADLVRERASHLSALFFSDVH